MEQKAQFGWIWGSRSALGLGIAAATLVVDQASKWWLIDIYGIMDKKRVGVLPFLDLVFVKNLGFSYGLGAGALPQSVLVAGAVLAAIMLTMWLARGANNALIGLSIGLIVGGAVGNAIDRIRLGGVADFFLLHAFGWSWYVFNIADAAIVAGVIGLLYDSFIASRNNAPN